MVSIVILVYNQFAYTRECIKSIRRNTGDSLLKEIIVIDNGSSDGSYDWLVQQPDVLLIRNKENLGFAAGCNLGMDAAHGDFVCLLNNDVIVTPGWLERLLHQLDPKAENFSPAGTVDVVGPVTNFVSGMQRVITRIYDGTDELDVVAADVYVKNEFKLEVVEWIIGFCMVFRKELIDEVGPLDEVFGLGGWEDVDFCMRVRKAGRSIGVARDVYVHHFGSITSREMGKEVRSQKSEGRSQKAEVRMKRGEEGGGYPELLRRNKVIFMERWGSVPGQKVFAEPLHAASADKEEV